MFKPPINPGYPGFSQTGVNTRVFPAFLQDTRMHDQPGRASVGIQPGYNLRAPSEIGIDAFQTDRSPTHMYRTAPLAGLWTHQKGGFYHDGRFATLLDVVNHYNTQFNLKLSNADKSDLIEYLKGI